LKDSHVLGDNDLPFQIEGAKDNPSETVVNTVLSNLTQVTDTDTDDALYDGELKLITETLENVVAISDNITVNDGQILVRKHFIQRHIRSQKQIYFSLYINAKMSFFNILINVSEHVIVT
jgi:hypothetical protein